MLRFLGLGRKRSAPFIAEDQWMDASIGAAIAEQRVKAELTSNDAETRRRAREAFFKADLAVEQMPPVH